MNLKISSEGLRFLTTCEGYEPKVYKDSAGLPTIGVGHLLTKSELSSGKIKIGNEIIKYEGGLTHEQIVNLLSQDLRPTMRAVNDYVKVELSQAQFDALCSFTFNVGINAFIGSTLLKELNKRHYDSVPVQMRRWNRAGGRVIRGLANRREKEIALWENKQ